ncbi:GIY-YIG nuclease family protein [Mucilaginibacter sp. KACC 22063]|uniref:GIY-YIG nuclease family protein n=1 Tax=Mucilaginibacter sp. KACC 22063 TaxID=3025666 RepID=UPI0023659538|nr:GIY-YIG nuclease family protein [Mucilaginibacter sp. KACC 22063]WDF54347.1 GIY-YIG nuclease family protein [Mucilaginibacter sp. KACC 22063]
MAIKGSLEDIFNDDPFGLLDVKAPTTPTRNADERLIASFEEINAFYAKHNREPAAGNGVHEHQLRSRLNGIRSDELKAATLAPFDRYHLLDVKPKKVETIADILEDDDFGLLADDAESIFNLKHVPKETTMPEYVASRKPCPDFEKFEHLFLACHTDIRLKKRKLYPFKNEQQIAKGYFFVLKGILLYVAEVSEKEKTGGKVNARLRCIFENGTESDMLLRSLAAELYKNGRRVTEHTEKLLSEMHTITSDDQESGYIYILQSLSKDPEIRSINNLYKIGFSTGSVEDRIKNAVNEPTYLMASVAIVSAFKCYNMNTQKLELLLHTFFGNSCLSVDIYDREGKRFSPREWFIAPLEVIEQAIEFIISGEIVDYQYDPGTQVIINRPD